MQIVIDINEEEYNLIKRTNSHYLIRYERMIKNGVPLPKGHGRIGDLTAVMNDINQSIEEMTNIGITVDGDYLWGKLNDAIDNTPTIIEADKAESEGKDNEN